MNPESMPPEAYAQSEPIDAELFTAIVETGIELQKEVLSLEIEDAFKLTMDAISACTQELGRPVSFGCDVQITRSPGSDSIDKVDHYTEVTGLFAGFQTLPGSSGWLVASQEGEDGQVDIIDSEISIETTYNRVFLTVILPERQVQTPFFYGSITPCVLVPVLEGQPRWVEEFDWDELERSIIREDYLPDTPGLQEDIAACLQGNNPSVERLEALLNSLQDDTLAKKLVLDAIYYSLNERYPADGLVVYQVMAGDIMVPGPNPNQYTYPELDIDETEVIRGTGRLMNYVIFTSYTEDGVLEDSLWMKFANKDPDDPNFDDQEDVYVLPLRSAKFWPITRAELERALEDGDKNAIITPDE